MAGLVGAGRTETAEAIFGMRHITGGKVYKDGEELHIKSPEHAIAHKIALLTEDRRGNGIVGMLSIKDNTVLASLKNFGFPLNHKKMREDTDEYVRKLNTKTPTIDTPIKNLSGGNQQKVLVGRWLLTDPDIPDRRRADPRGYRRRRQGRNPLADRQLAGEGKDHHDLERAARSYGVCPTASWSCMKAR